jgi:hypothetical protein
MHRYDEGANAGVVSLVGLGVVAVAVAVAIWWWTHGVWGNFSWSFLEDAATYVAYGKPERPVVGFEAQPTEEAAPVARSESTAAVEPAADQPATADPSGAPFCPARQAATFVLGFSHLKQELGATMGDPIECEHTNPANGDRLQHTSTGLTVYRPSTGELSFTDGWRHWALTSAGLVALEGDDRPEAAETTGAGSSPHGQTAAGRTEHARVARTDGLGLVLRREPSSDARTPRGLLEGTNVTVLERSGADWARVRGEDSGLEGWVPSQYLEPTD